MKDLLIQIITDLITKSELMRIEEKESGEEIYYSLYLDPSDMGRVIGKSGKVIRAVRTLLSTRGLKEGKHVYLTLYENTPSEAAIPLKTK